MQMLVYMRIYPRNLAAAHARREGEREIRGGKANISVCALCGLVQLPYPGLVLTFGVQHLTFALWAKRYFAPSCNKMNIQMMWQPL